MDYLWNFTQIKVLALRVRWYQASASWPELPNQEQHPMWNGIVECFNRTLLNMLGKFELSQKTDWKSAVGPLVHTYNCTRYDSTGFTPYELLLGRRPRLATDSVLDLIGESDQHHDYGEYMQNLKTWRIMPIAWRPMHPSHRNRSKDHIMTNDSGSCSKYGDHILVKIVAFDRET